jgi:polysaccharide export outer membrane protein
MDAANFTTEDRVMPVRSRGSLLAGTAALVGLFTASLGCQTSLTTDRDAFSIPNHPGQPTSRLLSLLHRDATPAGTAHAPLVSGFTPAAAPSQGVTPIALQQVPAVQSTANRPAVIASSWQPVQRVSAEQPVFGPELNGNIPVAASQASGQVIPVNSPAISTQPDSSPGLFIGNGSIGDEPSGTVATPNGNAALPQPRRLQPMPALAYAGTPVPMDHGPQAYVPREFEKQSLPPYVVEPPDMLLIQASTAVTLNLQIIEGQHLVAPDGTVNLGIYGKIYVAGMTVEQVTDAVAIRLKEKVTGLNLSIEQIKSELQVDVLSYNSKYFYVITDGGGYGQQVYPFLITGNETVLDALAKVNGLPAVASKKKVWLARATRAGQPPKIMPVDWRGITQCGESATNYQVFPGDRIYVDSDPWIKGDTWLAKRLSPVLRGFGATLLGASTVNTIKNGTSFGGLGGLGAIR